MNCYVDEALARRFREVGKHYGRLGTAFSAAMLMFLDADPEIQGKYLKKVHDAEVNDGVAAMLEALKGEHVRRAKVRTENAKDR